MAGPCAAGPPGGIRFALLGPLQVTDGSGTAWPVPAAKQRIVLAALLLSAGSVVSAASLADALWETSEPPNAEAAVRNYLMRLRRVLGPAGERIIRRPGGWMVELHRPGELDLAEVECLEGDARAAAAAGDWPRASSLLVTALAMWRGEPLADVPSAVLARRELGRLGELRLQLTEARVDADLCVGRDRELVAPLQQLTAEHPLREHLRAQLMLACYRSGQQAAALAAYREARQILAGELGVEPGPELRQIHQQILTASPDLMTGPAARVAPRQAVVPRQVPQPTGHFTGRAAELRELSQVAGQARADGTAAISVILGMPGIGKTALAVQWAHQESALFPDGQLFVNLRGYGPAGQAGPAQAIPAFLEALGTAPNQIPVAAEAQIGLYRSLLAGKRVLVVADNASDADQVRPLLPGSPGSMVIVTSRNKLTSLVAVEGARPVPLDILDERQAACLLAARLGASRAAAEPAAVTAITSTCAGLPLALVIAAARAMTQAGIPLAQLASELADSRGRLSALDGGDATASIGAVFSWSYSRLCEPHARMFRLMGLHPGPDISVPAAASLADTHIGDARTALSNLVAAGLMTECAPGRFAFHDLLRTYAADRGEACDHETERHEAIRRCLDHYLHTAQAAARALDPAQDLPTHGSPERSLPAGLITDSDQALAWFAAEHTVLLAVIRWAAEAGFTAYGQQLPRALVTFLGRGGHWPDLIAAQQLALACGQLMGDLDGQARAHCELGRVHTRLHDTGQARRHLTEAVELSRQLGDNAGQARAHLHLSVVYERAGRSRQSLSSCLRALALAQAAGDRLLQANACNNAGFEHAVLGDFEQALSYCRRALRLLRQISSAPLQATIWDSLGGINHQLGHYNQAVRCYLRAVELFGEDGDRYSRARTFSHLGDTHHAFAQTAAARDSWQQALASFDDLHHPDAASLRSKLADLRPRLPCP